MHSGIYKCQNVLLDKMQLVKPEASLTATDKRGGSPSVPPLSSPPAAEATPENLLDMQTLPSPAWQSGLPNPPGMCDVRALL